MKWLTLIAVLILAQQPAKAPEGQGIAEPNGTQSATRAKPAQGKEKQPANPSPVATQSPAPVESNASTVTTHCETCSNNKKAPDEELGIQRKLTWFTGALAVIGLLQFFALIGQICIYRRQAGIMEHQARVMTRQRVTMGAQLDAAKQSAIFAENATKATERADILLESATIKYPINAGFNVNAWLALSFRNFGRTRANEVQFSVNLTIPAVINWPMPQSLHIILGPDVLHPIDLPRFGSIYNGNFAEISNAISSIEVSGVITYSDVFGASHKTEWMIRMVDPSLRTLSIHNHTA